MKGLAWILVTVVVAATAVAIPVLTSQSPPSPSSSGGFEAFYGDDAIYWDDDGDDGGDDDGDDEDDDDDSDGPRFQLFGTAERMRFLGNDVIRIDTFPAGTFGGASLELGVPVGGLDRKIALSVYLVNIDCFGGSPRVQLRVDMNGDGASDGNAFGYLGPFPSFTGCDPQVWQYHDMTDGVQRWDTSQLVGATSTIICGSFVCTFAQMASFLAANFPNHKILRGSVVQDAFLPVMQGFAFYDDVQLGNTVLD